MCVSVLFSLLITVDNIYHNQNVSSNRNAATEEFRSGFKLLRLAFRFHIFSCQYGVNATPDRKNFVPFSNSAGMV